MAIKVHGSPLSSATQRVLATLIEKGVEYDEFVLVDLTKGEHKHPSVLSLNPFGQVPAFEDGDLKLFESRAITQYIAHTYADRGTPLVTQEPKKMAIQSVWSEVEALQYDLAASKLVYELAIKPRFYGRSGDEVVVQEFKAKLSKVLDVYEARLIESKFLGGDQFSLVDLHHLPSLNYLKGTKVWELFESRDHVKAWVSEITARPAWLKVIAPLQK